MLKEASRMPQKKSGADDFPGFEYIKSAGGIDEYRLAANGLTVLVKEDNSAPVANVMVTYHVGSRNEAMGHTGATHLLEHLLFKGSKKFSGKEKTIWKLLEAKGAKLNATTWFDRTNYFELVPSEHLETALAIEADRMRHAFIREGDRESEMTVVRNEFERGENDPFDVLGKNIWATAYQAHPYHHDTIGWRSDIENVSIERLKEFYDTFYFPDNATLSVIGSFSRTHLFALIREHFGPLSPAPRGIPRVYTAEPKQEGERRIVVSRAGSTPIVGVAHKSPPGLHPDTPALGVLSYIIGEGRASRLHRALVDRGFATDVEPWAIPFHDNGLFISYAILTPDTPHERAERIIRDIYRDIQKKGVSEAEVKRAHAMVEAENAFLRDGAYATAQALNEAIALGDWTSFVTFPALTRAVAPGDVARVAREYLTDDNVTIGWFVPKKSNEPKK